MCVPLSEPIHLLAVMGWAGNVGGGGDPLEGAEHPDSIGSGAPCLPQHPAVWTL